MKERNNTLWWQIIIEDPANLTGISAHDFLSFVLEYTNTNYIAISDAQGAGIGDLAGSEQGFQFLGSHEALNKIKKATQFDWCDFFFLNSKALNDKDINSSYSEIIIKTVSAVRAVDDTFYYVYTPIETLYEGLIEKYPDATIVKGTLDEMEFPY